MMDYRGVLKNEERIIFALRSLYRGYGYCQYRMSKFEEYDLYARNKDFLVSDNIITFNDTNGRLMALKPDVTLSIVRSHKDSDGVRKVYYDENVYRASRGGAFKEIRQVGLECIGDIGDYDISEAVVLAAESLKRISGEWALSLSHLGVVSECLDRLGVSQEYRQRLIKCICEKNLHDLTSICAEAGAEAGAAEELKMLVSLYGEPRDVLPRLRELRFGQDGIDQLCRIAGVMERLGYTGISIDFSAVHDMKYYNGIAFKGFVQGVPTSVLSGGQYDNLMAKLGKKACAIGFAVYLDRLEMLWERGSEYDVDAVLLYGPGDDLLALHRQMQALSEQGLSVSAQRNLPEKLRYKRVLRVSGQGVEEIQTDA